MLCKARGCRYPDSHNSSSHLCGTCKKFGHGQYECQKPTVMVALHADPEYGKELHPIDYCQHKGCRYNKTHMSSAHHCSCCLGNHSYDACPNKPASIHSAANTNTLTLLNTVNCPLCRTDNDIMSDSNLIVFGVGSICCICQTEESCIILPTCRHACLCKDCFKQL